jgi:hypothetical protein
LTSDESSGFVGGDAATVRGIDVGRASRRAALAREATARFESEQWRSGAGQRRSTIPDATPSTGPGAPPLDAIDRPRSATAHVRREQWLRRRHRGDGPRRRRRPRETSRGGRQRGHCSLRKRAVALRGETTSVNDPGRNAIDRPRSAPARRHRPAPERHCSRPTRAVASGESPRRRPAASTSAARNVARRSPARPLLASKASSGAPGRDDVGQRSRTQRHRPAPERPRSTPSTGSGAPLLTSDESSGFVGGTAATARGVDVGRAKRRAAVASEATARFESEQWRSGARRRRSTIPDATPSTGPGAPPLDAIDRPRSATAHVRREQWLRGSRRGDGSRRRPAASTSAARNVARRSPARPLLASKASSGAPGRDDVGQRSRTQRHRPAPERPRSTPSTGPGAPLLTHDESSGFGGAAAATARGVDLGRAKRRAALAREATARLEGEQWRSVARRRRSTVRGETTSVNGPGCNDVGRRSGVP